MSLCCIHLRRQVLVSRWHGGQHSQPNGMKAVGFHAHSRSGGPSNPSSYPVCPRPTLWRGIIDSVIDQIERPPQPSAGCRRSRPALAGMVGLQPSAIGTSGAASVPYSGTMSGASRIDKRGTGRRCMPKLSGSPCPAHGGMCTIQPLQSAPVSTAVGWFSNR